VVSPHRPACLPPQPHPCAPRRHPLRTGGTRAAGLRRVALPPPPCRDTLRRAASAVSRRPTPCRLCRTTPFLHLQIRAASFLHPVSGGARPVGPSESVEASGCGFAYHGSAHTTAATREQLMGVSAADDPSASDDSSDGEEEEASVVSAAGVGEWSREEDAGWEITASRTPAAPTSGGKGKRGGVSPVPRCRPGSELHVDLRLYQGAICARRCLRRRSAMHSASPALPPPTSAKPATG
jgi:hypothetical protein